MIAGSADADLAVGDKLIGRHRQIGRRRSLPDAAGGVVLRTMARAEPAIVIALMGKRDAAEMGADADKDEPLIVTLLDARRIRLRVGQARDVDLLRFLDLFLAAMADEDRLRAPEYLDDLPLRDRPKIDIDRGAGGDRRGIRIHLADQRPDNGGGADRSDRARGDVEEITACRLSRRNRSHSQALSPCRSARARCRPSRTCPTRRPNGGERQHRNRSWEDLKRRSGGGLLAPLP